MERKIGEIFEHNGEWYQCVEQPEKYDKTVCAICDFHGIGNCELDKCSGTYRSDKKSIIFRKLKKVGEPYMLEDKKFQKYRIFHTPYIYNKINYSWQSFADPYYISLEIKQNKEDMEEKEQCGDTRFRIIARAKEHLFQSTNIAEDKKELEALDSFLLRCWQMGWLKQYEDAEEKKLNLKPFDLQKAREGKPVCTRDGRKARIIAFDRRLFYKNVSYPILALVERSDGEDDVCGYNEKGKVLIEDGAEYKDDLMMLPEKKEGWVNVYKGGLLDTKSYPTQKEAFDKACPEGYVDTVKINWSE